MYHMSYTLIICLILLIIEKMEIFNLHKKKKNIITINLFKLLHIINYNLNVYTKLIPILSISNRL